MSIAIKRILVLILFVNCLLAEILGQDSLRLSGQISAWSHYNPNNTYPWWNGGRYIPELYYGYDLNKTNILDLEASVNLYGNAGFVLFDSASYNGEIKPYRLWTRYSNEQFEFRIGLQKINFGSASILRPLMWFDQIDPRDPLQLTDGVWGALSRYYFLNNTNIWLWILYGNKNTKGWESFKTTKNIVEYGGRIQFPLPIGESAITYHHRTADCSMLSNSQKVYGNVPENKLGIDAKFDIIIGCWLEASWSHKSEDIGMFTNQHILNAGLDYTFNLGNGLTFIYEQLIASFDEQAFAFENTTTFSLLNVTYPIGLFDNLSAIIYYDWTNRKAYNFINWQRSFNKFSLYFMGYINPKEYNIPTQAADEVLYAGTGVQIMAVFNY